MIFDEEKVKEFSKDLDKLVKKHRGFDKDFLIFKQALETDKENLSGVVRISGLGEKVKIPVYKARKFRCKSLNRGSMSGIRVIFAYDPPNDKIIFIEIYCKSQQENEDKARILKYFQE